MVHRALLFHLLRLIEVVSDRVPATDRRERNYEVLCFERVEDRSQGGNVGDRLHAGRTAAEIAFGLRAPKQQLAHDGQFQFVDAEPFVREMAVARDAAATLHFSHNAKLPQAVERQLDLVRLQLHLRVAVAFLIAAGDQGIETHRVLVGGGLALFDKHAEHASINGR